MAFVTGWRGETDNTRFYDVYPDPSRRNELPLRFEGWFGLVESVAITVDTSGARYLPRAGGQRGRRPVSEAMACAPRSL
jgi:hypothetical protein